MDLFSPEVGKVYATERVVGWACVLWRKGEVIPVRRAIGWVCAFCRGFSDVGGHSVQAGMKDGLWERFTTGTLWSNG